MAVGAVITATVWILYFGSYYYLRRRWRDRAVERERSDAIHAIKDGKVREEIWKGGGHRENSMILMGSIFIVAAFTILAGASIRDAAWVSLAAPTIYCIWLFTIQLSTRVMNDTDYELRLVGDSDDGRRVVNFLRDFYGEGHGNTWMMRFRRNHWLGYVAILWLAATYLVLLV